jgi:hypothetical protein
MAHWRDLPEGYYAVPDPRNAGEMSYWRRKDKGKSKRPSFDPWLGPGLCATYRFLSMLSNI